MNSINPVSVNKSAEYQSNLQATFRDRIGSKEENGGMFSNALGEGSAVKIEISSLGAEMSEKVKNGEMPEGVIKQLERTPLTKEQLRSVPNACSGEEILAKMRDTDPDAYKEYETLRTKKENSGSVDHAKEEAHFILKWAMRDALPQLSCWKIMDERDNT